MDSLYCWQHKDMPPWVPSAEEEALIDVTDQLTDIIDIAFTIITLGASFLTARIFRRAVKEIAGGKRVKNGIHYIIKRLTRDSKAIHYNETVTLIKKNITALKYLEKRVSLWKYRKNVAEKALDQAGSDWAKDLARKRIATAERHLREVQEDLAIRKNNISDLHASLKMYRVPYSLASKRVKRQIQSPMPKSSRLPAERGRGQGECLS